MLLGCLFVEKEKTRQSIIMEIVFFILLFVNITFLIRLIFMMVRINVFKIKAMIERQN